MLVFAEKAGAMPRAGATARCVRKGDPARGELRSKRELARRDGRSELAKWTGGHAEEAPLTRADLSRARSPEGVAPPLQGGRDASPRGTFAQNGYQL